MIQDDGEGGVLRIDTRTSNPFLKPESVAAFVMPQVFPVKQNQNRNI